MESLAGRRVSTRTFSLTNGVPDKENVEGDNVLPMPMTKPPVPPKPAFRSTANSTAAPQSPAHSIKKPFSPAARSSYNARHRSGQRASKGFGDGTQSPLTSSMKSLWSALPQNGTPSASTPLKSAFNVEDHAPESPVVPPRPQPADAIPQTKDAQGSSASRLNGESPLFIRRVPALFAREDSSKVPSSGAETPFKFKVTVGPNKREVVAEVAEALSGSSSSSFASLAAASSSSLPSSDSSTPRRDYIPIMRMSSTSDQIGQQSSTSSRNVLNDSYSSLSRRTGSTASATTSASSTPSGVSTRKRENCDYSESPAKRRRISIGTKSTRQTIVTGLPVSTMSGTGTSGGRDIPTAASIFAPLVMPSLSSTPSSPARSRSNSVSDANGVPSTPSGSANTTTNTGNATGLNTTAVASTPLGISTLQLQSACGASTTAHLTVPASKDSEVPLSIEEIAAWIIFGQDDVELTKAFLLSFIHFKTTAKDLFKMIWQFYYQPPLQYWKLMSTFANQRSRVVSFVTLWTSVSPGDFELSPPPPQTPGVPVPKEKSAKIPLKFYIKFLETLKADGANSDELDLSSTRSKETSNAQEQTPSKSAPPSSPRRSLSKRQSKFGARRQSSVKAGTCATFMKFDPADFAVQLTVFELRLLKAVPLSELVGQAWNKPEKELNAPRITNIINHFNRMSFWVGQEIAQAESAKEQGKRIDRFISVGKKLKDIGNFNALMEIFSGLMSSNVQRLTEAWKTVPSRQMARLKKIESLMSPFQNAGAYRTRLAEFPRAPVIPYFGVHLSDIVHLIEGVEDECPDKYALQKVLKLGSMISCWHTWQKQTIDASEDLEIIQFILTLKATVSSSGPQ